MFNIQIPQEFQKESENKAKKIKNFQRNNAKKNPQVDEVSGIMNEKIINYTRTLHGEISENPG